VAPRTIFSSEAVVEAGFQVLRQKGLKGLTARNLGRKLKASPMPVYSSFGSMRKVENAVIEKVKDLLLEHTSRPYTDLVFLNMGVGIAIFAREEPALYRAMFLERNDFKNLIEDLLTALCERLLEDEKFRDMPRKNRMAMLQKMWVYTHGLAALICVGVMEDTSDAFIISSLRGVGRPVSLDALRELEEERKKAKN
jgi:AcrR family transcriptional regulator